MGGKVQEVELTNAALARSVDAAVLERPGAQGPETAAAAGLERKSARTSRADRDDFLDGLRCISILRVLALHTFLRFEPEVLARLTFFTPGMPLVFFVSGALAARSLSSGEPGSLARYWLGRARRLLWPFWGYGACVVALCLASYASTRHAWHALELPGALFFALPLADPIGSPAFQELWLHLWFMPVFLWLLATAPLTWALHKRWPFAGVAVFLALSIALETAKPDWPQVVGHVLLFGVAFQLGYAWTDGRLQRLSQPVLGATAALLLALGWAIHDAADPAAMVHEVPLAHLAVGLGWLAVWLFAREPLTYVLRTPWLASGSRAVNRRAYTLFLFGPAANEIAWRASSALGGLHRPSMYLAFTVVGLVIAMRLWGRFEDRAARRAFA